MTGDPPTTSVNAGNYGYHGGVCPTCNRCPTCGNYRYPYYGWPYCPWWGTATTGTLTVTNSSDTLTTGGNCGCAKTS